jgi:hypothetical protein
MFGNTVAFCQVRDSALSQGRIMLAHAGAATKLVPTMVPAVFRFLCRPTGRLRQDLQYSCCALGHAPGSPVLVRVSCPSANSCQT